MRIESYAQVQQLYTAKNTGKTNPTAKTGFSDQLQISNIGKDIQIAKQAVANSPDVREEVTAPIKSSIQNGTYEVNEDSFADKLIAKYNQNFSF